MKTLLKALLILIISLVLVAIALAAYVLIKNPLGLRDVLLASYLEKNVTKNSEITETSSIPVPVYDHPLLSAEQELKAAQAGIDVSKLPTSISLEQQQCVNDKLGEVRVLEIIKGASPAPLEIVKALPCF